jgi:hypothetical protein
MAMKSRTKAMGSICPRAILIVDPVMKSKFNPKYQSMKFFSLPLVKKAGTFFCFFLRFPVKLSREALGQYFLHQIFSFVFASNRKGKAIQAKAEREVKMDTNPRPKNTRLIIKRAGSSPRFEVFLTTKLFLLHGKGSISTVSGTFPATGTFAVVDHWRGISFLSQSTCGTDAYGRALVALGTTSAFNN